MKQKSETYKITASLYIGLGLFVDLFIWTSLLVVPISNAQKAVRYRERPRPR